jgi:hypothetical protein
LIMILLLILLMFSIWNLGVMNYVSDELLFFMGVFLDFGLLDSYEIY